MVFNEAKWICSKEFFELEPINVYHKEHTPLHVEIINDLKNVHTYFKKDFIIDKKGSNFILNITGDDYYRVYINGIKVGQGPAQGYPFAYYYNQFDITEYLTNGQNEIFVDVYYCGVINRTYNSADRRMGLIAEIYCEGKTLIHTDNTWEYCVSDEYKITHTIGYDTMFVENFDSRKKPSKWQSAFEKNIEYTFCDEPAKALQIYTVEPEYTEILSNGGIFVDFGKEITAGLEIIANGKNGDKIRILCGEETDDSDVKTRYNMRCTSLCEEFWTLDDGENYYDQYEYRAFRYATIIPDNDAEITSIKACVRHYPFDDNYCELVTDNQLLKDIWEMCKNTVKCGAQEVFVDCPTREKGQYAGDLTITSASHYTLTGDISLFKKAIDNQMQSGFICKGIMAVTPGSMMQEIADYSLQFPILALRYYEYTKDKKYLAKCLITCENIVKHFSQYAREDGLLDGVKDKWNLVDWPANLRDGYDFAMDKPIGNGVHNVINAFYIGCVKQTEQIKDILKISYDKKSESLIKSFDKVFYDSDKKLYKDSENTSHCSLHSNVLPAYYEFANPDAKKSIVELIMNKKFCCGVYMAYFMLKALCKMGKYKEAYSLIISKDECSWYNMLKEGATSCFEAWGKDKKANTSLCHPWATGPISILAEDILPNLPHIGKIIYNK